MTVGTLQIGELYARYIKPLPLVERLRLVELIARDTAAAEDLVAAPQYDIMRLHGLGAEIWQGIDAQEYVNALRDEWDHRPCRQ